MRMEKHEWRAWTASVVWARLGLRRINYPTQATEAGWGTQNSAREIQTAPAGGAVDGTVSNFILPRIGSGVCEILPRIGSGVCEV